MIIRKNLQPPRRRAQSQDVSRKAAMVVIPPILLENVQQEYSLMSSPGNKDAPSHFKLHQNSQTNFQDSTTQGRSLVNTEILTDQVLRQTEEFIQRPILDFKHSLPFQVDRKEDYDQQLVRQIQNTCRLNVPSNRMSVPQVNHSGMMENLIQLQDPVEQWNQTQRRQQAVLQKFYVQAHTSTGIAMSSKLQKLLTNIPQLNWEQELNSKDSKQLELLAQLSEDKQHERLLEQALLKDFYLNDKRESSAQVVENDIQAARNSLAAKQRHQSYIQSRLELERWLSMHQSNQVRLKIRGIDEIKKRPAEKSYSLPQDSSKAKKSEERRKKIELITQRTNKYKIDIVRQFIKNDLQMKKRQNIQVIDYLMDFNPKNIPTALKNVISVKKEYDPQEMVSDDPEKPKRVQNKKANITKFNPNHFALLLRKIFFLYSKKDEPDFSKIYREMTSQRLLDFLKHVGVTPSIVELPLVNDIVLKVTKNKLYKMLNFADFQEVIRKVAFLYCTSNSPSKFASQRRHDLVDLGEIEPQLEKKSNASSNNQLGTLQSTSEIRPQKESITNTVEHFYLDVLLPHETDFFQPLELEIKSGRYVPDFIRRFEPILQRLFAFSFELKGITENYHNQYLKFDDVFELLWRIDLFPRLIAKSTIRCYYYYMINNNEGLDIEFFCRFCNVLGLQIVRSWPNRQQLINSVLKERKNPILNYVLAYFRSLDRMNKTSLQLMVELGLFYTDVSFLDAQNLESKLSKVLSDAGHTPQQETQK